MSTGSTKRKFVEIEVPRGAYLGWGTKPGQQVVGRVVRYDEFGGTDFNGAVCPNVELVLEESADSFNKLGERTTHEVGATVQLNAGQVSLKRALRKADLHPDDVVQITLVDIVKTKDGRGTVKEFNIAVAYAKEPNGFANDDDSDDSEEPNF